MTDSRPKGCEQCQENCTIHLTQIIGNQVMKVALCSTCPYAEKIKAHEDFDLIEKLLGKALENKASKPPTVTCPNCGITDCDLQRYRRFGCPECYATFKEILQQQILPKLDVTAEHCGKVPGVYRKEAVQRRTATLESLLKEVVAREDYEGAAKIRDALNALKFLSPN